MGFQITPASLKKLCKDLKLYSSCPELNDVLHLQCKGITKLEHLEAYTGLKTLYLENNAIDVIEGLEALVQLRSLYLGKNLIHRLQGLATLTALETLDVSDNDIRCVEGLEQLRALRTLNLSGNKLQNVADVAALQQNAALACLDVSGNKIDDPDALELVLQMPLALLRLVGNPIVSSTRHYRKHVIAHMPSLNHLDDEPVTSDSRALAAAFQRGGLEEERAERQRLRQQQQAEQERHRRAFDAMVEQARAAQPQPHDPMRFRAVPPGESESDAEGLPANHRTSRALRGSSGGDAGPATSAAEQHQVTDAAQVPAQDPGSAAVEASQVDAGDGAQHELTPESTVAASAAVGGAAARVPLCGRQQAAEAHAQPADSAATMSSSSAATASSAAGPSTSAGNPAQTDARLAAPSFARELRERAASLAASQQLLDVAGQEGPSSNSKAPLSRPEGRIGRGAQVWSTPWYKMLWDKARLVGERQEQEAVAARASRDATQQPRQQQQQQRQQDQRRAAADGPLRDSRADTDAQADNGQPDDALPAAEIMRHISHSAVAGSAHEGSVVGNLSVAGGPEDAHSIADSAMNWPDATSLVDELGQLLGAGGNAVADTDSAFSAAGDEDGAPRERYSVTSYGRGAGGSNAAASGMHPAPGAGGATAARLSPSTWGPDVQRAEQPADAGDDVQPGQQRDHSGAAAAAAAGGSSGVSYGGPNVHEAGGFLRRQDSASMPHRSHEVDSDVDSDDVLLRGGDARHQTRARAGNTAGVGAPGPALEGHLSPSDSSADANAALYGGERLQRHDSAQELGLEAPADLLQRARAVVMAPSAPGTSASTGEGDTAAVSRPDSYHKLASEKQDPRSLAQARAAVLGSSHDTNAVGAGPSVGCIARLESPTEAPPVAVVVGGAGGFDLSELD